VAGAAFQNRALSLPEIELYSAMAIGTLHGIPTAAAGILVLLAASRLSPNRPALALVAATLISTCVILISFLPPFLAYKELDLTGSAILRYTAEVERLHWWALASPCRHTNPVSRGMLAVAEARPRRPA
jgi:hypothetical protein